MVTEEQAARLPWDSFLDAFADGPDARRMVEGFREIEWPNIKRELGSEAFQWQIPDGLEPHWVSPGKAVYWQAQVVKEPVEVTSDDGSQHRELQDVDHGWAPTSGLPANNASVISRYLEKGLRLRPPAVDVEPLRSTVPAEVLQGVLEEPTPVEEPQFFCRRHGYKRKGFKTWKTYVIHCNTYKEDFEYSPPEEVMERAKTFPYFCFVHNKGFTDPRHAGRHAKSEAGKARSAGHPTLQQMLMKTED